MAIALCIAWLASWRATNVSQQKLAETTKAVEPAKVESATDTLGCCGVGSLDERELVQVNYTDKADNGEILVYAGPAAARLALKNLVDSDKLRAIKLDKGPVNVYLGSITNTSQSEFEHYFGTIRRKGVVSDIGCVRLPRVFSSQVKEKGKEGMVGICFGMYLPAKKPKELRAGVLSPKEGVINF